MPKNDTSEKATAIRPKMTATGSMLEHMAESMTLSSDPGKRAAAARWLKMIRREMAKARRAETGVAPANG